MKKLKDFSINEKIDLPKEVESVVVSEEDRHKNMDPPNILIMRRKSIRQFPNNQRVALYFVDKINKYVTVPYTAMQWSTSTPEEYELSGEMIEEDVMVRLEEIVENRRSRVITFEDGKTMLVGVSIAETILKVYGALNENNQEKLAKMANESKEQFSKVIDFTNKNLK